MLSPSISRKLPSCYGYASKRQAPALSSLRSQASPIAPRSETRFKPPSRLLEPPASCSSTRSILDSSDTRFRLHSHSSFLPGVTTTATTYPSSFGPAASARVAFALPSSTLAIVVRASSIVFSSANFLKPSIAPRSRPFLRAFSSTQPAMVASNIDGTALAKKIRDSLRAKVADKQKTNPRFQPCLRIIQGMHSL